MKNTKLILSGGVGVILFGVLSSAIWDLLKPATSKVFEGLLYISVLGFDKYKNGIYVSVAKGFHESVSIEIYTIVTSGFLSFVLVLTLYSIKVMTKGFVSEHVQNNKKFFPKKLFLMLFIFYGLFAFTFFSLEMVKQKYINSATTHFEQLFLISQPYLSDDQEELYSSQFAQIQTRSDYIKVIKELENIAKKNAAHVPELNFIF